VLTQPAGATGARASVSLKGVVAWQLEQNPIFPPAIDSVTADQIIAQMTGGVDGVPGLNAGWTRILVYWDALQPRRPTRTDPGFDAAYVDQLKMIVSKLTAAHMNVILTPTNVPRWASDRRLWKTPPAWGGTPGYGPWLALAYRDPRVLAGFRHMAAYLASQLGPLGATRFEVWNEPNISRTLYPQRRGRVYDFGLRVYAAMLKAFWRGIKGVDPSYLVIAGATAPYGNNSTGSTSPVTWARNLKKHHLDRYFDAYSHHPYTLVGSRHPAPNGMPNDPAQMVNLANLSVLLDVFPDKPFYITEFGYATRQNPVFGYTVSPDVQASYLTKAFAMVRQYPQVKALLWYALSDWSPDSPHVSPDGVYTGLMNLKGRPKPSWSAFANVP
jgi:hypothetical protein